MLPEMLIGIAVIAGSIAWRVGGFADYPTVEIQFWQLVTYSGAAYLAVGLVRDVIIKIFLKAQCPIRKAEHPTICLESTIGPIIVFQGLGVMLAGVRHEYALAAPTLGIVFGALCILSGLLKDLVVTFQREKNHIAFIPW